MFNQMGFAFLVNGSRSTSEQFVQNSLRRYLSAAEAEDCMLLIRYRLFCIYVGKVISIFDEERDLFYTTIDDYNLRVLYSIDDEVYVLQDVELLRI